MSPWKIHKFGGSSLADAACFRRVSGLMLEQDEPRLGVVVSAMAGTTDALLDLTVLAERGDLSFDAALAAIGERYAAVATELLSPGRLTVVLDAWSADAGDIRDVLKAIELVRSAPPRSRDVVAGYGEIWSARLLAAVIAESDPDRGGHWIDARQVIVVRPTELGPAVVWNRSREGFANALSAGFRGIAVMTGFIASDEDGLQTTLGRNGSDYSAAIFAALASAAELSIWTDVDGIMSADPRLVPEARVIEQMTYSEAMELAYFGARILHPQTLGPVIDAGIPLVIRNSLDPTHPGSRIAAVAAGPDDIKGITAIGGMALINLEGAGMIGVPGTAERLFRALYEAGVSVTLISQASSEHSICIAVPAATAGQARDVIAAAFEDELAGGRIQRVEVTGDQSIIAVVGDNMAGTPGIAARFFGALGRSGINVRAIAQGSSERNISAVVDAEDATRALRAAHAGFYLSSKTLSIGLIGPGTVGATLLAQLDKQAERLASSFALDLRVRAIARSSSMLIGERRLSLDDWQSAWQERAVDLDFEHFERHVNADHMPHAVIIDCTASDDVAARYAGWLERGIHVITPNKKAFSGDYDAYVRLREQSEQGSTHYFYETTVGAALPIITTLRDLIDTGDEIHSIQGILSGTLAYLFNVYDGSKPFSDIVRAARESGYTEPDPRDDLSGMDVARKLTILARELGQPLSIGDFPVQDLVPEALRDVGVDEFLERLSDYDDDIAGRYAAAAADGRKLRYIATLDAAGNAAVALEAVDASHPFSNINLTDNVVQFQTARYSENPLVVQGPGAGPEVTAAGVFSDLLRLASYVDPGH